MDQLTFQIRQCKLCTDLPFGANPVVQLSSSSKIVIIGQAPGRAVHNSGIPWDDRSGETLRSWLGVTKDTFYDAENFSVMGMGFCYPGKGTSGDLGPRPQCAKHWHPRISELLNRDALIILIGQYAQKHYLKTRFNGSLTETVRAYREFLPEYFVLPHPSPRNQLWLRKNPWFEESVIPELRKAVRSLINRV